jgi:hypothetical protein
MDDGTFRYVVASLGDEHIETVPGLYAERQLVATDRRVSLSDVPYLSEVSGPLGRRVESIHVDAEGRKIGGASYTIVDEAAHNA